MATKYDVSLRYGVDPQQSLSGKVVAVVGGFGGIAMATNEMVLQKGGELALVYPPFEQEKMQTALEQLNAQPGGEFFDRVACFCCDVTIPQNVEETFEQILKRFTSIDALVNSAGYVHLEPAIEVSYEQWQKQVAVNLTAPFLVCSAFAKWLIESKRAGKIVNIASQAASIAIEGHVAYTSAKAGLLGMTKVMALEWAPHGINVNTISPTVVLTPMGEKAWQGEKGEEMKAKIPMGRFAYTDEIAAAVIFLITNGSDMINGADIMIDGGYTIY
ncbi:GolD/DthD family dehydrogenase [Enterovibrio paralichthyis]|uniref:GolD/DthD family dehydrogenase n=1 Tax=Enterovibrio paralichthyis TaxID=2853805 RepID=UPI001C45EBA9|nr:D-threitol dehydrogenase [Enterovibrio paralichthyis]MBV7297861.1 D-threitol dehydrogenase [Enterovibrio paralichthyis]